MFAVDERKSNIKKLEKLAEDVLDLKKQFRQRRPIVVEFCGCPKAGKTSTINALNIFLKRNGFKTAVLAERASICPIPDKQCPSFNVWTCTSTINEINEKIDLANSSDKYAVDIILCDRGIFDALCWFKWLKNKQKMRQKEYQVLTDFAMLNRWQKNIDLVYIFLTDPSKSIEREFANLLTDKRGSIMNEEILEQYKQAVKETYEEYKNSFRATEKVDTTETDQCQVGYDVTEKTLQVLKEMLMEKIGYFDRNDFNISDGITIFGDMPSLNKLSFDLRDKVENQSDCIQPIAIAVMITPDKNSVFCVRKTNKSTKNDSPEYGKNLLYVGGHMRAEDKTVECDNFVNVLANTLERELFEELGVSIVVAGRNPDFKLYKPTSEKSKKHVAIGWVIEVPQDSKFILDSYELVQKKGRSKSGTFVSIEECASDRFGLEEWSKEILKFCFKDRLEYLNIKMEKSDCGVQLSMFENNI